MRLLFILAVLLISTNMIARADQEASNGPLVRASTYGVIYARSVPDEDYGQEGTTLVYYVGYDEDTLLSIYDWYASEIYIGGCGDATVVRFGPWHRGREPRDDHLAIGIYRDGVTVAEYSTLELYEMGNGISASVSHYQIFQDRLGFRWIDGNSYVYEVEGMSGDMFIFDLDTGDIIKQQIKQD